MVKITMRKIRKMMMLMLSLIIAPTIRVEEGIVHLGVEELEQEGVVEITGIGIIELEMGIRRELMQM